MSTRRPASTTSLSRYARPDSPDASDRALDFCNAFWGLGDGGVDVLFARMRGAARTAEELRAFWKERALIEEDYAKRLAKLAKTVLGRDEIGELRNSFDTVRLETDKQATAHMALAQQMRKDLEQPVSDFIAKQAAHKKNIQGPIEKLFKTKQTQENHVNRTREKYESDCIKINAFTGQSALVQGRELDKLHLKLEKLQETVKINEREFGNFVRALADTTRKWDTEWKTFCDQCQDLEDERIEFMKDNMWNYANSISTVCVSDDESCEKVRIALESIDTEKEIEYFVRHYGTGNDIPNPPQVISYQHHDGTPYRQTTRPADFIRNTSRPVPVRSAPPPAHKEEEEEPQNNAGIGAGGRRGRAESVSAGDGRASRATSRARRDSMPPQTPISINGHSLPPSQPQQQPQQNTPARSTTAPIPTSAPLHVAPMQQPPHAGSVPLPGMVNPAAFRQGQPQQTPQGVPGQERTQLKIGQNVFDVDPKADPQNESVMSRIGAQSSQSISRPPTSVGDAADPLAQQLANLRNGPARNPTRRGTMEAPGAPYSPPQNSNIPRQGQPGGAPPNRAGSALQAPAGAFTAAEHAQAQNQALNRDYHYSAENVVGAHPASRPVSPAAASPTAEFMRPRGQSIQGGAMHVEDVVSRYGQALPDERRLSRQGSYMAPPGGQPPARSPSPAREGYAGIGARRSPSPAPPQQGRMASPSVQAQHPVAHPQQQQQPPPQQQAQQPTHRHSGIFPPVAQPPQQAAVRATSPSPFGIALDASGHVTQDSMAEAYRQAYGQGQAPPPQQQMSSQQPQMPQQMPPQQQMHPPQQQMPPHQYYGQPGYGAQTPTPGHPQAGMYGGATSPAPPASYGQVPPPQQQPPPQQHAMPPQQQHSMYQQYPNGQPQQPPYSQAPPGGAYYPQQQQPPTQYGQPAYGQPPQQQQQQRQASPNPPPQQQPMMTRTPSPLPPQQGNVQGAPPTGQYLDDGSGVLFYVKAMYNYTATIEEEFDFQEGDIIAVTSTPEDGWWHGVLLDDTRRVPGRTVFPSNFVTLF